MQRIGVQWEFLYGGAVMTASSEILASLAVCTGSASSKAFVAAICEGEGGTSWRILYAGGTLLPPTANVQITSKGRTWTGSLSAFPTWGGARLANGLKTTAAGAPQFIDITYAGISRVSGRAAFEDQDQIQNCWDLAAQAFSAKTSRLTLHQALEAGGSDLLLIPAYLGKIWIGGANSGFPKRFVNNLAVMTSSLSATGNLARLP